MSQYHVNRENLFDQIVIGDEKWIHHFTAEMKSALKHWIVKDDDHPVKVKRERLTGKVYLVAFWDNRSKLL